ncbi:MAG: lectin MVL [Microcystis aeruginosa Ma_AC_P_19900807_S300]|nr:MAG: lectin MVL [Microcystis aeruginosa Ma_AC_P_19900807_S300]
MKPSNEEPVNIPAGPLWSNAEAQQLDPRIAAAHQGNFTGQWTTVVESAMSVVEVELQVENTGTHEFKTDVLAGPLWSNDEAQKLCPQIAASYGAEFTGQWRTIVEGVMSVIQIKYTF